MVRKQYKTNDEITSNNICIVSYNLQPCSSPWYHFILTKILQIVNILCPHFTNEQLNLILVCRWMFKNQLSGKKNFKALSYSVCPFPWCKHSIMSFSSYQQSLNTELGGDMNNHLILTSLYEQPPAQHWVQRRERTGPRLHRWLIPEPTFFPRYYRAKQ